MLKHSDFANAIGIAMFGILLLRADVLDIVSYQYFSKFRLDWALDFALSISKFLKIRSTRSGVQGPEYKVMFVSKLIKGRDRANIVLTDYSHEISRQALLDWSCGND